MLEVREKVTLAPYTVFKIGGPARFFVEVSDNAELMEALGLANKKSLPFFILGAGSNVLISDQGFDGLVIRQQGGGLKFYGEKMIIDSSVMMARAVGEAAKQSLAGFEWGIGIPGTIGGSIRGNAGCFGGEMSQVLETVQVLEIPNLKSQITNKTQNTKHKFQTPELSNLECEFGYRDSIFKRHPEWVIFSAVLNLVRGGSEEIYQKIRNFTAKRFSSQDIGAKCAGCIFKNVFWRGVYDKKELVKKNPELGQFLGQESIPAGFLIDRTGLKGLKIGQASVSIKHGNYFINEGMATAEEVIMLISLVKSKVKKKYGIILEEEIQYVIHS